MPESFTEDIFTEILLWLPVKSLMRFKCVSKRCRSLISNPGFAKSHLQRLKARDIIPSQRIVKISPLETIDYEALDGGIGGGDDRAVVELHEPRMDYSFWKDADILGSCDGLVCLAFPGRILTYNPTTKECRSLPGPDFVRQVDVFRGFGYDSQSDDYKIVQGYKIMQDGSSVNWQVDILSLKSVSLRRIEVQQEGHLAVYGRGVYWNGALHWCILLQSRKTAIMSFDLSEEKFHQALPVPRVDGNIAFLGLGIHGAGLFIYSTHSLHHCLEVWKTNEYGSGASWTKLFSVSTDRIPGFVYGKIPIAYTRSGKIVLLVLGHRMVLFNPEDNTCKDYPIQTFGPIFSVIYLETLVSPYLGGYLDGEPHSPDVSGWISAR